MAEESLLLSHTEDLSASPNKSSSLVSEISNASTRPFVLAFTVGSCGALSFGCIVGYTAPTQTSIMKDLNLSIADFSFFGSILTVGLIVGALICGKLADLVGRVYDVWLLDLGRLLQGISVGISSYLGPIYISELAPRNLRGAASSLMQLFVGVGISVFYALGTVLAWRNLAILGSIPSLVVLPLLFFVPESPRWLAKVGREKEVEGVLLSLRGAKSDVSDEAAAILEYTKHVEQQDVDSRGFFKLFQRKYALPLTIGVVLISVPQLGGLNGYTFYTDTIFTSTGVSSDVGFILTSIVQMFGGILGVLLIDISGRRSLLLVSQAGMFLGCLATAISFFLQKNNCWEKGTPILALISVMVYFGSYGLGMGPIPWIIASEIYPVDVKGAAGTVCNLTTSISSWLVTYSFNFLLQWSSTGTFMMFATVMGLGFVFTAKLVPETKGKSLEEIQSVFTDSPPEDSTVF
ncbi:sugar transporter ERD6-like 14 isoform X2 [Arabidopsis lyrata subsp. lyrata]|uniref:sugar transporter ERD6-like 14 isoform X2 n=1 Tax=Arabidopsis lyrata subsp. lyrata TaxID=81972 RepID=UPI000A29CA83|nr:sugar transporter ERD6-like 14 isoform X2 [Arabidopsis lyrata subsp. lyrata]|eukprot:XP_020876638.1 sugar transporter ERD6-like 14 isoform X2 [Arabidopsis lyrata subsp. lyrata]